MGTFTIPLTIIPLHIAGNYNTSSDERKYYAVHTGTLSIHSKFVSYELFSIGIEHAYW